MLGGGLLYLLCLIVQMPVAWLIARMPVDSPIQMRQASGTLWHGTVEQVDWRTAGERIELGRLGWNWLPGEILHGRLGFDFELAHASDRLSGMLLSGRQGYALQNVQGRVDAALLGFAAPAFGLMQPQGSLLLKIDALSLSSSRIHGDARIDWQGARSGLIAEPLGHYRAALQSAPDGKRARIEVQTLQGALAIQGQGDFLPGKGLQGDLRLTPPSGESGTVFRPLLNLVGRPDAGGSWRLQLDAQ
jgi:general secretion pathway protein N